MSTIQCNVPGELENARQCQVQARHLPPVPNADEYHFGENAAYNYSEVDRITSNRNVSYAAAALEDDRSISPSVYYEEIDDER